MVTIHVLSSFSGILSPFRHKTSLGREHVPKLWTLYEFLDKRGGCEICTIRGAIADLRFLQDDTAQNQIHDLLRVETGMTLTAIAAVCSYVHTLPVLMDGAEILQVTIGKDPKFVQEPIIIHINTTRIFGRTVCD